MANRIIHRRRFLKAGLATAVAGPMALGGVRKAEAGPEEDRIVAAAKKVGPAALNGMMWSLYWRNYPRLNKEFKDLTGIYMEKVNDVPNLLIPQRAMAEAISRSGKFDFFHVESMVIPSLVAAGLCEPLDGYMKEAGFKLEMVGKFGSFMTYRGKTYAMPTDGNVCPQLMRKDLMDNPDERKRFADKHGKPIKWPETFEDELELCKFFHRPEKDLYGFGGLRDKANSSFWYWMYLYAAGGFPFTDDAEPQLNTPAAEYAMDIFLRYKEVSHPEAAAWGSPQMIPRLVGGKIFSCQYWDGIIAKIEGSQTPTKGKMRYGVPPGSKFSGKLVKRAFSAPVMGIIVNKLSPRKKQAAMWALYMSTAKNSTEVVAHPTMTFHDPWSPAHFSGEYGKRVAKVYTEEGMNATRRSLLITTPPPYVTGYVEFKEAVDHNLSEAYNGRKTAKAALKDMQNQWKKIVRKVGKRKLKQDIHFYKQMMPTMDVPPA